MAPGTVKKAIAIKTKNFIVADKIMKSLKTDLRERQNIVKYDKNLNIEHRAKNFLTKDKINSRSWRPCLSRVTTAHNLKHGYAELSS